MNKKDIFKMAKNPRFIPGIYNYCDRWCERCSFTSRCMVYAMEQEDIDDPATRDINNEAFWEKMQFIFQQTLEMITDMAQEQGIDLDSLDVESEMKEENLRREKAENHELSRAALTYSKIVDQWFESEREIFEQKEDELNTKLNLGIEEAELNDEAKCIMEAVEVIHWYQHQIYVKLMRGLMGDDFDEIETEPDTQNDSNGSVKVALIGIDRSISAWGELRTCFPEKTDEILTILLHLDRLRRKTEEVFPDARDFIRPGFDTIDKNVK